MKASADAFEKQVKNAYSSWDLAFNSGDAKAVAAFYTENAYLLPATHDVIKGPAGVEKFFAGLFSGGVKNHKLEVIEADGDGILVYAAAKWSASGKDDKGEPAEFNGIATHIFEKQADSSLKLKLHTFN
jgi:ketosteroid isomerase-like protein